MQMPLAEAKVTSEYGIVRSDGKLHKGIDLISNTGDRTVRAIADGRVSYCGYDPTGFGRYVSILHNDLRKSLYCHLKSYNVTHGQAIKAGEQIGIEGNTGKSKGVHLHLEIRTLPYKTDDHINVADYLGIENQKGLVKFKPKEEEVMEKRYHSIEEVPEWGRETISKMMNLEILQGDENGDLNISRDMLVVFVTNDRAGLYDF